MINKSFNPLGRFFLLFILIAFISFACTEEKKSLTIADYQRAESFLSAHTRDLVYNAVSSIQWQADGRVIYARSTPQGSEYILANPSEGSKEVAFDHNRLAESLNTLTDGENEPYDLNLRNVVLNEGFLSYQMGRNNYQTDLSDYTTTSSAGTTYGEHLSPDGRYAAYIKDHNLWIRDTGTDEHRQLTFDGIEDYGYATNNAGWTRSRTPVLLWSPQSDKIATFRHDGRGVGEMYLYTTNVGHSRLDRWKYPLPGDSLIFRIERVVIHLDNNRMVRLDMPPDPHRSTTTDHIAGRGGRFLDVEWSDDGEKLGFVSSSRDHKIADLRVADPYSGEVRDVLREEVETYYESGYRTSNWRVLHGSDEFIWFSERSDWGHLYLYDLNTGELKNPITSGEWAVLQVQYVDEGNRQIYFLGSNREEGNPYFHYLYRVNMDGTGLVNLTPEIAHHTINWSEDYQYFVDTYSTTTEPPVSVVRDASGTQLMELEKTDISALTEKGWVAPEAFTVKARDSVTDLYGLMYKPTDFDPTEKYPILNYLYPGPQSGSIRSFGFRSASSDKQALAELGFIVVEVNAMGTPGRSKSFHDIYYGNMGDNGLPDQMAMIRQLAAKYEWMDLDRVGIWGHSGGGFASTDAILRYPDFYKVAVSGAGNHDNRNYEDDWGEKWQGLLVEYPEGVGDQGTLDLEIQEKGAKTNYDNQANQLLADNLKGKLLIAHGMMDGNVPPTNTLLVVDALIKADKDFDMLVFPNAGHGFGNSRYFMKRRWDYFVEHLKGIEPPDFVFSDKIR